MTETTNTTTRATTPAVIDRQFITGFRHLATVGKSGDIGLLLIGFMNGLEAAEGMENIRKISETATA